MKQFVNLHKYYITEDLFPKIFADYVEKDYGILFYNDNNKDSYDSNHAVIYREKIGDLQAVLEDIKKFYETKGQYRERKTRILYCCMRRDDSTEKGKTRILCCC